MAKSQYNLVRNCDSHHSTFTLRYSQYFLNARTYGSVSEVVHVIRHICLIDYVLIRTVRLHTDIVAHAAFGSNSTFVTLINDAVQYEEPKFDVFCRCPNFQFSDVPWTKVRWPCRPPTTNDQRTTNDHNTKTLIELQLAQLQQQQRKL